jgi:hypothetical protein
MTCGTSVAQRRRSACAASDAATVMMSATTTSGSTERISSRVDSDAHTAAAYGFSGLSRVGKTWYSGAAAKRIPSRSTCSRQRDQVSSVTS